MGGQSRRLDFLGREVFDEIVRHCKSATPESPSMRKAWSCSQKLRGLPELLLILKFAF